MSFVVLDTDVSSASLRGRLADPLRARLTGQTWCISFVTVGELTKWTVLRAGTVRRGSGSIPAAACANVPPNGGSWHSDLGEGPCQLCHHPARPPPDHRGDDAAVTVPRQAVS